MEQSASGRDALRVVRSQHVDLAYLGLDQAGERGLDLVTHLISERPQLDVVVITARSTVDTAVEAMRRGAVDYLPKPLTRAQIHRHVAAARARCAAELRVPDLETGFEEAAARLETASPRMRAALEVLARAAMHDVPVLLRGERGSGHGILAQGVHGQSRRRDRPFAAVTCGSSEEQLASDLFGHAAGALDGAAQGGAGRLELGDGGTVLVDDVCELTPALQERLLRFLREKRFERTGEALPRRADVRIVAATSRDVQGEVKAGRFREELLYALNVVEVIIPPLRERTEDVLPLARALIAQLASRAGRAAPDLARAAEGRLLAYSWPGNLRELRNVIERALILTPGAVIGPECLPEPIAATVPGQPVLGGKFTAEEIEKEHVRRVLSWAGTQEEASRILGVAVSTLWRKQKRWTH